MLDIITTPGAFWLLGLHGRWSGRWSRSSRWCRRMICVAYLTLWERGHRLHADPPGPNRASACAAGCSRIADAVKLIFREIIVPTGGEQGPVPPRPGRDHHAGAGRLGGRAFGLRWRSPLNAGLLFLMAITSMVDAA